MYKKCLAVLLCTVILFGLLVGCNSSADQSAGDSSQEGKSTSQEVSTSKTTDSAAPGDMVTVSLHIPTLATYSEDAIAEVEAAMNELLAENYGIQVDITYIEMGNFEQAIQLAMTTDEIDVTCYFPNNGTLSSYVQNGQLLDITDYFNNASAEFRELFNEDEIATATLNDRLWSVPRKYQYGGTEFAVFNADMIEELGIDPKTIIDYDSLAEVLYKAKEAFPDVYALAPQSNSEMTWYWPFMEIGGTSFAYVNNVEDTELFSLFELERFQNFCNYTRQWYVDGLIMPDAISNTMEGSDLVTAGRAFCTLHNGDIDPLENFYPNTVTTDAFFTPTAGPSDIGNLQYGISANSTCPDEAFVLLEAIYMDEELIKLLCYGIEGEHWVLDEDGRADLPEGITNENNPYGGYAATAVYPNYLSLPPKVTAVSDNMQELVQDWNDNVEVSVTAGFYFDTEEYTDFVTAYANLEEKYRDPLMTGSIGLDDVLDDIIAELESIGYYEVLAEVQSKLDTFLAEQE